VVRASPWCPRRGCATLKPCLVAFHAHPDDEAIFTGGTIVRAVRRGWRVLLVVATSGESGARPGWVTNDLAAQRRSETELAARLLGVERVVFLGYRDSGVEGRRARCTDEDGVPTQAGSSGPPTLAAASIAFVAKQLRRILVDECAVALTSYDRHGIYGHRDHVCVHEIAALAVQGTICDLMEATVSRTALRAVRAELLGRGLDPDVWPASLVERIGVKCDCGLLEVDVAPELPLKVQAVAAHASQVVEASSFMGLPPGAFHRLLGVEWFRPARVVDGRFAQLVGSVRA